MSKLPPDSINISGAQNVTVGVGRTTVRIVRGGGIALQEKFQERQEDREQFTVLLGQLECLVARANPETIDHYYREIKQFLCAAAVEQGSRIKSRRA